MTNCTFSGNSATFSGGGIHNDNGTLGITNTIVANTTSGGDCVHGPNSAKHYVPLGRLSFSAIHSASAPAAWSVRLCDRARCFS